MGQELAGMSDEGDGMTLTSTGGARVARPRVMTIVGLMSMFLGFEGVALGLAALLTVCLIFYRTEGPPEDGVTVPRDAGDVIPYDGDAKGPAGLGRADRYVAGTVIDELLRLPVDRRLTLRWFLGEQGARVFGVERGL